MKKTFASIKFWMDKILSIACAILLSFMTILVLIQTGALIGEAILASIMTMIIKTKRV